MGRKVFVKTVPRETATKVHEFRNITKDGRKGKPLQRTKLGNCKTSFQPLFSRSLGGLVTGLEGDIDITEAEYKKAFRVDPPKDLIDKSTKLITVNKQEYFEHKHNKPKGFYNNMQYVRGPKPKDHEISFFQGFKMTFNDGTTTLDLDVPSDELTYQWCLSNYNKFVAKDKTEIDNYKKPFAQFYISYEGEEDSQRVQNAEIVNKAIAEFAKLNEDLRTKYTKIFGLYMRGMNSNKVYRALDEFIKDNKNNLANPKAFLKWVDKNSTPEGRAEFEAEILLIDLIDNFIVSNKQETYRWAKKDIIIGHRKSDVISFLMNPHKSQEKEALEAELVAKRGF